MAFVLNSFFVCVCWGLVSVACFAVDTHASASCLFLSPLSQLHLHLYLPSSIFVWVDLLSIFLLGVVHAIICLASFTWNKKKIRISTWKKGFGCLVFFFFWLLLFFGFFFCCSSLYCKGRRLIMGLDFLDCHKGNISRCGKPFN